MRNLLILIVAILSSGCSSSSQPIRRAETEMIGMSKAELLSCAGVPLRQDSIDNLEVVLYRQENFTSGSNRYCEVTFTLKNGSIEKLNYTYRYGGWQRKFADCNLIVRNCITRRKAKDVNAGSAQ